MKSGCCWYIKIKPEATIALRFRILPSIFARDSNHRSTSAQHQIEQVFAGTAAAAVEAFRSATGHRPTRAKLSSFDAFCTNERAAVNVLHLMPHHRFDEQYLKIEYNLHFIGQFPLGFKRYRRASGRIFYGVFTTKLAFARAGKTPSHFDKGMRALYTNAGNARPYVNTFSHQSTRYHQRSSRSHNGTFRQSASRHDAYARIFITYLSTRGIF